MNRTKIEWVKGPNGELGYTWNPLTGCLHGCGYCYARRIAERFQPKETKNLRGSIDLAVAADKTAFPYGFAPTFYPDRFREPYNVKHSSRIFTVSMGDLFGDWVPREWIDAVIQVARECQRHTFLFLTKNPIRYKEFSFPENAWLGTTVENQAATDERIPLLLQANASMRFISVEPILGPVNIPYAWLSVPARKSPNQFYPFKYGTHIDWIIVGAQTGPGAVPPLTKWVMDIIGQARLTNLPVFLKYNLKWPKKIQEYPA